MRTRVLHRAAGLAIASSLIVSAVASADSLVADGDVLSAGAQSTVDVGTVAPGGVVEVPIEFVLGCTGTSHLDLGQVVTLSPLGVTVPDGGDASVPGTSFTTPSGWPGDGLECDPAGETWTTPPTTVTLTAPSTAGGPYAYDLLYRATSALSLAGIPTYIEVRVLLRVGTDEPPVLELPEDVSVFTGDPAGAVVEFTVGASDAEDDPDPTVTCTPPTGSWFPVGTTTVVCTTEDSAGHAVSGSFEVAVRYDAPVTATFEAPVARGTGFVPMPGRSLPVKVRLDRAGQPIRDGQVDAVASGCDPGIRAAPIELRYVGGRWMGVLRTPGLAGCDRVDVRLDGRVVGGFDLVSAGTQAGTVGRSGR